MEDFLFKVRWLFLMQAEAFKQWREDLWMRDLDSFYCCDGGNSPATICGCEGATVREAYSPDCIDGEGK